MDERILALQQAIELNAVEIERWEKYLNENETAISNLEMMVQRLRITSMVPLGSKAFIPGEILYTNNILVGHNQDFFSTCSAQTAKAICKLRVQNAKDQIKKYQIEAELWKNKLETPTQEGAFCSGTEKEIIEDYDEERERLWRIQHKQNLKKSKLAEKEKREMDIANNVETAKNDAEIFQLLENAELMEELHNELENMDVNEIDENVLIQLMKEEQKEITNKKEEQKEITNKKEEQKGVKNMNQCKSNGDIACIEKLCEKFEKENNSFGIDIMNEDQSAEITYIKSQAEFLDLANRSDFYDYQIEIIQQKLKALSLNSPKDLTEKVRLLSLLEQLDDLQEKTEVPIVDQKKSDNIENNKQTEKIENNEQIAVNKKKCSNKRRISFAENNSTIEFCQHEPVLHINQPKNTQYDSNKLKSNNKQLDTKTKVQTHSNNSKQNLSENSSELMDKAPTHITTLCINFKHSIQPTTTSSKCNYNELSKEEPFVPNTPADIYDDYIMYLRKVKTNENNHIKDEKTSILTKNDQSERMVGTKSELLSANTKCKSILSNKNTTSANMKDLKVTANSGINDNSCQSAFKKVMKDVVEKSLEAVDPLPEGNFIDTHKPKKRISRYKRAQQEHQK